MEPRFARRTDAAEIVRLAAVMFESMGEVPSDAGWIGDGKEHIRSRLGDDLAAFVVDDDALDDRLVACAAGTIGKRLPGPYAPGGRVGYIQWVCTDDSFRGRGLARSVMEALLGWYESQGVSAVELHATPMAEDLYRSMGFCDSGPRAMRRIAR